ncbi:MAG: alpha/beta hydrolase [Pseudomonadota bacterium]
MSETAPYLDGFKGPVRIFWGMEDPFFPVEALRTWQSYFPEAETTELPKGRHYIQEDAPDLIIKRLREFLQNT